MKFISQPIITPILALEKARKYCAFSERCHFDVRLKLKDLNQEDAVVEWIIAQLIEENFINEDRFAHAYTIGKLKHNKWGKIKIKHSLLQKGISAYLIKKSIESINDDIYIEVLNNEMIKKIKTLGILTIHSDRKVISFLQQKGFETYLINEMLKQYKNLHHDK